jgi:GDPmannose 4,6-dehydratase
MWLMLQQDAPRDYVIATGIHRSVREFVHTAGRNLGFDIRWEGEGIHEKGIDQNTGRCVVAVDPTYFRPTEVNALLGDASLARDALGWKPKTSFEDMVAEMIAQDLRDAERDLLCRDQGFSIRNRFE